MLQTAALGIDSKFTKGDHREIEMWKLLVLTTDGAGSCGCSCAVPALDGVVDHIEDLFSSLWGREKNGKGRHWTSNVVSNAGERALDGQSGE